MKMEKDQEEVANQQVLVANIDLVKQFLKLKPTTFNGGMNLIKANEWLIEMEKKFWSLICDKVQKVEICFVFVDRRNRSLVEFERCEGAGNELSTF